VAVLCEWECCSCLVPHFLLLFFLSIRNGTYQLNSLYKVTNLCMIMECHLNLFENSNIIKKELMKEEQVQCLENIL
jgi:hypothetical protein